MKDIHTFKPSDEGYFPTLKHLYKPPKAIYVRGEGRINFERTIAVVGTRRPSTYGKRVASLLTRGLAEAGFDVVSGLAFGIDSIAHQATLKAGRRTIAVVPGGLDKITPSAHAKLAEDIVNSGGMLISEQAPGEPPHLGLFVTRNRIIAALSRAVIVIEAAERSGSLSTARFALEIGREVLAVPGEIDSVYSSGTNQLIRSGATLIRSTSTAPQPRHT
jgi:DNA processing protein